MARISYDQAYPRIQFLPSSRNWWAKLKGTPAECVHLNRECRWIATLMPDTLYLRGKSAAQRDPVRPEVSLCRECLLETVSGELESFAGRVVAFEPDPENFTQYFFMAAPDFEAAGIAPEVRAAIEKRLDEEGGKCSVCARRSAWLWFSREQVASLDDVERISGAPGEPLCAAHGAEKLTATFEKIKEANVFYMNLPYGEAGAYVWI